VSLHRATPAARSALASDGGARADVTGHPHRDGAATGTPAPAAVRRRFRLAWTVKRLTREPTMFIVFEGIDGSLALGEMKVA